MTTLRAILTRLWATHCRIAESITPHRFALIWDGVAVACFIGSIGAPDPATGLVLAFVGIGAACMAWANETGRFIR